MSGLRDRAYGNEVSKTDPEAEAIERSSALVLKMQDQFEMAMPRGAEAAQLVRDALTLIRQTPKLALCNPQTLLGGLMTMAQLGLRPGVLGHGWLIPFRDKHSRDGSMVAQLVIGYQGYVELAYRSNRIGGISAHTVYDGEQFEIAYGTEEKLIHRPLLDGEVGKPIGYYCVVHIKDGQPIFKFMTHQQMLKHRDRYAMAQKDGRIIPGTPWAEQFEGMAHKTCLRQLSKWMPKSADLSTAIQVDEGFRLVTPEGKGAHNSPDANTYHVEQVPNGADSNEGDPGES